MNSDLQLTKDFPILDRKVHNTRLVYFDNAATTQKPEAVMSAMTQYYQTSNANVHRGVHTLSDESTLAVEKARKTISSFLGADASELILVRNTTEALNGILYGWALHNLAEGEVVITSQLEHHSNFVVWQEACKHTGAELKVIPVLEDSTLDYKWLEANVAHAKLIALTYVSNAVGSVLDVERVVTVAKKVGARVAIDGAQAVAHMPVSFKSLGVDFFAFSGHKMYGPMGSGGLLVRSELFKSNEMQPWLFGGGMIAEVYENKTKFHDDPIERFTAGTPDVASAVGLAAACEYLSKIGMKTVEKHDEELVAYAFEKLQAIPQVTIVGPTSKRVGSVSFLYEGVHSHDVAQVLDSQGIAVRSGHHCTMPLHVANNWIATTRASFAVYNSKEDIDLLVLGLQKVAEVFGK